MPERKEVMAPFSSAASARKRDKCWAPVSAAPSHDRTTNRGGSSPAASRWAAG
jgi:hypothetical protein